ncbi:tetratricopeptide repeat protein [Methylocapsa palsarum]|uniref:Ancillary SecYEG translocon subunit/Cell division coordinator CpoB TPR domain-containing protein n=1 Tax=Methylocapsa palsarum TaxID=1612308 RepID=A0A1I3WNW5_9HYPH|nr:tetratricopeptide repeat protein [Methylocapsa palsarum]SFK09060.1 hypothetical protein SAMN05444581_10219 [Methylocapsa palsarum]
MTDLFREVDEDVRRDRAIQLWTRYQYWVLALALLVVVGTVGFQTYVHFRDEAAQAAGAEYEAAVQLSRDGKTTEAEAALAALGQSAAKGYAALARLRAADEIAKRDPAAAIEAYDKLAADQSINVSFRDLAELRAAFLRVDHDDYKDLMLKLSPLANPNYPYQNQIRELLGITELKRNDFEAAGRWFDAIISDPITPTALRQRIEAFITLVQGARTLTPAAAPTAAPQPAPSQAVAPKDASPQGVQPLGPQSKGLDPGK